MWGLRYWANRFWGKRFWSDKSSAPSNLVGGSLITAIISNPPVITPVTPVNPRNIIYASKNRTKIKTEKTLTNIKTVKAKTSIKVKG